MLGLDRTYYSDREYSAYQLMTIGIILALIHQTWQGYFPGAIQLGLSVLVLIVCIVAINRLSGLYTIPRFVSVWKWLIIYFFIIGCLYFDHINLNYISWSISQDLRYCILFLMGGYLASSYQGMSYFHHIMKLLAILSVVAGFYSFLHLDLGTVALESRTNTWTMSYLLWWIPSSCYCYWGYYVLITKKDKLLGYAALFFYAILGFLFLKRSAVIDVLIVFIASAILSGEKKRKSIIKVFFSFALLLGIMYLSIPSLFDTVWNMLFARFEGVIEEDDFERTLEYQSYFRQAPIWEILIGNGIGHQFTITGTGLVDRTVNAIHSGWANLIYKGGIVYVLFYLVLYRTIFKNMYCRPLSNYEKVCCGVALSHLISLVYGGGWTYTIMPFGIAAPIFYASISEHDESPKIKL